MFTVYKMSGQHTDLGYIGYTDETDVKKKALSYVGCQTTNRGIDMFLEANKNDTNVTIVVLATVESEEEAFLRRNEFRANDWHSITGPSQYPGGMHLRCGKLAQQSMWKTVYAQRTAPTADVAYREHGAFGFNMIMNLAKLYGRDQITSHMESMTPHQFCTRYAINTML